MENGYFVASLDFEIMWGVRDRERESLESYKENLLGVHTAIPKTLDLFQKYGIRGTFAIVGLLFFETKKEMMATQPANLPLYHNKNLSPYGEYMQLKVGENYKEDPYHFAPLLIQLIKEVPDQEICTHTFSHYYCLEDGQSVDDFRSDLNTAILVAHQRGIKITSIIFPRNQFNENYLQVCKEAGIISYRNNERSWLYEAKNNEGDSMIRRAFRLADAYFNITGYNCYGEELNTAADIPVNIPSSRFLRPYSKRLVFFDNLRMRRIKKGMTYAAQKRKIYHLWWHPHNFGSNQKENFDFLEEILLHYQFLKNQYNFTSITMNDLAERLLKKNNGE